MPHPAGMPPGRGLHAHAAVTSSGGSVTRLAVIGNISLDTAIYPNGPSRTTLGGGALHVALAATRAGLAAGPVSVIGSDLDRIRTDSRLAGIDWSAAATRRGRSATFTLIYTADGELAELDADYGAAASLTDHALARIRAQVDDRYHVCCRRPLDIATILHALSHSGRPFSIDFMVSSARQAIPSTAALIHRADVVFVNSAEYQLLTAAVSARTLPAVIVTDGPRPARLFHEGRLAANVTPPPTAAIEVTGAGDTLTGTFLAARAAGQSESAALYQAVLAAARHTAMPGLSVDAP